MAYNTKYKLEFTNEINDYIECFFDYYGYVGQVTSLMGAKDSTIKVTSTGTDDDVFYTPIGKELSVNFVIPEGAPFTIRDFISTNDKEIIVRVYANKDYSDPFFEGFVMVEDNSQPFFDSIKIVTLKATDQLALLQDIPFTDLDGDDIVQPLSIIDIFAQILYKTSATQNIRSYFSFAESSMQKKYDVASADALRETMQLMRPYIGKKCGEILQILCEEFKLKLFQQHGIWHLVNLYEYISPIGFSYVEYSYSTPANGLVPLNVIDSKVGVNYDMIIGSTKIIYPCNDDQILYFKLPLKSIKYQYNYDQTANKLCNQDIQPAGRLPQYDQTFMGQPTLGYYAACWEYFRPTNSYPPSAVTYLRMVNDNLGYQVDRYLVVGVHPAGYEPHYLNTSFFYIDKGDKINLQFQWRATPTGYPGSGNIIVAGMYLDGDDGNRYVLHVGMNYTLGGLGARWQIETTPVNKALTQILVQTGTDVTAVNFDSLDSYDSVGKKERIPPVPVSGKISFAFTNAQNDGQEYNFKGLQITLTPLINGAYSDIIAGDYNLTRSNANVKPAIDDTIVISDSPKRWFTGALLKVVPAPADFAITTPTWRISNVNTDSTQYRFTALMEKVMYQLKRNFQQKIEGTFKGYTTTQYVTTGYLNLYIFIDEETDRKYMLTSYEFDLGTGQWRGVFVEAPATWVAPDFYEFNLIQKQ